MCQLIKVLGVVTVFTLFISCSNQKNVSKQSNEPESETAVQSKEDIENANRKKIESDKLNEIGSKRADKPILQQKKVELNK